MQSATQTVKDLERKFWQSLVDNDPETAVDMLGEPSLMVSSHGSMKFDHAAYRRMAEKGDMVLTSYELGEMDVLMPSDSTAVLTYRVKQVMSPRGKKGGTMQEMHDTSTWVLSGDQWKCVMHTETPADQAPTRS